MKRLASLALFLALAMSALGLSIAAPPAVAATQSFEADPATLGAIPDAQSTCALTRDVAFNISGLAGSITDVSVGFTLDPAHTFVGDLVVDLLAPNGTTSHTIFGRPFQGSNAAVAGPYVFSDSAAESPTWWEAAAASGESAAIPAGSYRASVPRGLTGQGENTLITPTFAGLADANGTWTLRFCDREFADTGTLSAATLYLTTDPDDQPPVAVDDEATVNEGAAATPIDVLSNDTNADEGLMVIASVTQPVGGTVAIINAGSGLTYQPKLDYCNDSDPTDDFTYTLNGGSTATVAMIVTCVGDPPGTFQAMPASLGPIPDNQSTCATTRDVVFDVSGLHGSITDVSVRFTLDPAHTWVGDLLVELRAPDGARSHPIFGNPNSGADVAGPYVFSDSAAESPSWWQAATAAGNLGTITSSSYRASVPASAPNQGQNTLITPTFTDLATSDGAWSLRFCDKGASDVGTVSAATLYLTTDSPDRDFEADPETLGPIPDGQSSCSLTRDVGFDVSGMGSITDVSVVFTLDPAHTWVSDLVVELRAPDGTTSHTIFGRPPDDSDVAGPYLFSDAAPASPTWWEAAAASGESAAIPAGSYRTSVPAGQPGEGLNTLMTPVFAGLADANGTWTLRFCDRFVSDTGSVSAATLFLTTDPDDQLPLAVDDEATVDEGAAATPIDVLANDTDVDGGPKVIASATQPADGTVVVNGSNTSLTYRPTADHCNDGDPTDDFTYSLNGGSTATVSVTVVCTDQPPVAFDDIADGSDHPAAVQNGGPVQIDVLANDTDPDGGPMFIDSVVLPSNGTVVVPSGGQHLTYEPNPNYCNDPGAPPDDFTYTLNGGATATVLVTVRCLSAPPDDVPASLTFNYSATKKLFKGVLSSEHPDCVGGRLVTIWKEAKNGPPTQIGQTTAAANGSYKMKKKARKGRYHATVETQAGPGGADCLGAKSPTKRVR